MSFDFDKFVDGYIECALWADCWPAEAQITQIEGEFVVRGGLRADHDDEERFSTIEAAQADVQHRHDRMESGGGEGLKVPVEVRRKMIECGQLHEFVAGHYSDLLSYCIAMVNMGTCSDDEAESYAGHDFWLTRSGHGAGFWDRGLTGGLGERLTEASKAYGSPDDHNPYDNGDGTVAV